MDAVEAGVHVARKFALHVDEPVLLRSTNNVVVWLRPSAVVAKIGMGRRPGLRTEVSVAAELSALGGPVVPPASELPAVVHSQGIFDITFWRYCPQPDDADLPPDDVAAALRHLHASYAKLSAGLRANLPSYLAELQSVAELLLDAGKLAALPEADRLFLSRLLDLLGPQLRSASAADAVIHGSPHPYNVLVVGGKPRFIDFETTSIGPIEWDLAHTSPATALHYAGAVDTRLLQTCRDLVRVKTAAWCWADVHRGDLRQHAEMHLKYLKETFGR